MYFVGIFLLIQFNSIYNIIGDVKPDSFLSKNCKCKHILSNIRIKITIFLLSRKCKTNVNV